MGSTFLFFAFGGIFLYGLSWGSSNPTLRISTNNSYMPVLIGYSVYTVSISFLLNSNLNNPATLVGDAVDYATSGWDAIEVGVFGALLIAGLPFFILSQSRPATIVGPTSIAGLISLSAGLVFLSTDSLWLMFVSFEFLLLSALYMLLLTSKSERVRDAALEMFI